MINEEDKDELEAKFRELFGDEAMDNFEDILADDSNTITLTDDDGNDVEFEFLDLVEYCGRNYVVLLPTDEEDNDGRVVILEAEGSDGDEESYSSVEDDVILEAVYNIFKEKFKDEFNFDD